MVLFLEIVFCVAVFLLLHSYLFYPIHLILLNGFKTIKTQPQFLEHENCGFMVSCIISVYNEESIIEQKLKSVLESNYPMNQVHIYVGSDSSSDRSNQIISQLAMHNSNLHFFPFEERRGKASVINDLIDEAFKNIPKYEKHILLFTDANVILSRDVIKNLCSHFNQKDLALVDSRIIPTNLKKEGISHSENQYMSLEVKVKHLEGELWGAMMGAFGGCFAIRSNYIEKVPPRFLMDDFFISMSAFMKNGKCKNDLNAICYEGIPDQMREEFKRKTRISSGNFQNLSVFYKLLFRKPFSVAYAFFSHKLLRWIGPFLIIIAGLALAALSILNPGRFQLYFVSVCLILVGIPLIDYLFSKLGIHFKLLRGIRYFIMMNIALLIGFINYIKGIQKSSWQPPKRSTV
jgi:cellulose synthase/poly-beta-1,6-N-acetylglucosamine synthase-like glycosyltransferase